MKQIIFWILLFASLAFAADDQLLQQALKENAIARTGKLDVIRFDSYSSRTQVKLNAKLPTVTFKAYTSTRREVAGTAATLDVAHLGAFTHGDIAHTNRVALDLVSGTNTGDNATNSLYSGLVSNATHTGDATGSTALTVSKINGTALSGLATGILKNTTTTGVPSIAVAGTDYLAPTGSAAALTSFPTLNQSTTGTAANVTGTVAVANGGTGRTTGTTAYSLVATGTTATGAQQTLANGATTQVLVGGGAAALPAWTTATGSGAPVRATSPVLVTPNLGTPSAGVATNLTGTAAGLTAGAATALAANGANCSAGQAALGVDASGVSEGCFTPTGTYALPTATASTLGGVKPDGTSIQNTAGVISATPSSIGALPAAAPIFSGVITGSTTSAGIELGNIVGVSGTPFVDFHSSGFSTDYDARIIATGGINSAETGSLTYRAASHVFAGGITSPTLVTPILGTPASGNLANCTFPTLNQSTTGSAAKLTTARTINGVAFDGSANITVADSTKSPLAGPGASQAFSTGALTQNNVKSEGSIGVQCSTSWVSIGSLPANGSMFWITGFNIVGGAEAVFVLVVRAGAASLLHSFDGTGLGISFQAVGRQLQIKTTSGTYQFYYHQIGA